MLKFSWLSNEPILNEMSTMILVWNIWEKSSKTSLTARDTRKECQNTSEDKTFPTDFNRDTELSCKRMKSKYQAILVIF